MGRLSANVTPRQQTAKSQFSLRWRGVSSLVLLLSLISAPLSANAQSKEQEKRGIGIQPAPTPAPSTVTPATAGDKPALILQTGHTKSANAAAFSPDNRWLASGGKDNLIKIWDLSTGNVLRTLYGHTANINTLAVSPDGKLLASGSGDVNDKRDMLTFIKGGIVGGAGDNSVRIWDIQTGRELQVLRGHEFPVGAVSFGPDGHTLTSASGDSIKVWDVASGREMRSQKTKFEKGTGEKLGSFSLFGKDKKVEQVEDRIKNFQQSASKIALSANGQLAAVGQPDKGVKLYDAQAGREVRELSFKAVPEAENCSIAFSKDARVIAFAKTNGAVSVQETSTGREFYSVNTGVSKSPQRAQFSGDGRLLVTATDNTAGAALKLWEATTGQLIRELKTGADTLTGARVISFSSDGSLLATIAPGAKAIRIIEVATGNEFRTLQTGTTDATAQAQQAEFIKSIDPKVLAKLQKRDITTPEQIIEAVEAIGSISNEKLQSGGAVSFSPDGRFLISRQVFLKKLLTEVWDASEGMLVQTNDDVALRDRGKPLFSPDGRFRAAPIFPTKDVYAITPGSILNPFSNKLADVTKQKINLYDGNSDKRLRELDGGKGPDVGIIPVAGFSFNGNLIAITGFENKKRSLIVFETEKGRKVNTFPINDDERNGEVATLCLSADGRFLAAAYATKIDIFEVASGRTIRTLMHPERAVSLTFSPDGRLLVALGENNDKYIWETASGEKLATLVNLSGAFNSRGADWLVVTPDGLFDGSPSGWKQMLWQFGGNTFDVTPAETFFNEFYYPGLFAELMAGKKPRAPKNISQLDRRQPELKLMTENGSTSERNLTVKLEVTEKPADKDHQAGSGARDVRLFRNGSLVKVWRGDVLKGQTSATLEANIAMVAGENRLTAYAFNRDNVKSKDASMTLTGAASLKRPGTAYVLTIGVNSYSNPQYNLRYAVADASAFGEQVRLEQQQIAKYEHIEVASLLDEQATKANILRALKRLAGVPDDASAEAAASLAKLKATEPEDAVFIYFAGHGTAQGQRFYLLPHDLGYAGERTRLDAVGLQVILEHSISDEELERAIEGIDADKLLMVIDACNSGQALEAEEKRRGPMNSKGLAQLAYEKGMYILTAAQSYQAAQEASQLGHGLLTYALVEEGLKQAAADSEPRDGAVGVREWFDYASTRVPQMQLEKLKQARGLGVKLSFVEGSKPVEGDERAKEDERLKGDDRVKGKERVKGDERVKGEERVKEDGRVKGEDRVQTLGLVTQTPRVFYRRESEARPLIVAKR
jgi:WD40 repeat protein